MRSVRRALPLLLLLLGGACVDLAAPVKVIDQPEVGPPRDGGAPGDGLPDRPKPPDVLAAVDESPAPIPAPDALSARANGEACASAAECHSGFCADGLCCAGACVGACLACNTPEQPGSCVPVPAGQDPDEDCLPEAAGSCGRDGLCDGQGGCRRQPEGSTCAPGTCSNATEVAASTCRDGACQPGSQRSCAPGVCMGASCGTSCAGAGDCQNGFFCDGGACRARRANGVACTAALQCDSGQCVDGVCCASACNSLCQACNLTGSGGTCASIPDGTDPAGECPAQPTSACGRTGGCNGSGACRQRAAGTACSGASCTGTNETATATCNGVGTCSPGATRSCGAYLCGATSCRTSCTGASDCQSNHKCTGGLCLPNKIASLVVHDTTRAGDWSIRANFATGSTGAHPWLEWAASYVTSMDAPGSVLPGNEWLRVATDSKEYTGGPQATLTLGAAADVYMFVDDRWGTSPAFTAGWSNAGWKIRVYENATRPALPFSVFRKTGQTGSLTLPPIGATTAYNYFIVVH